MPAARTPADEIERLAAFARLDPLGRGREPTFSHIASMVAATCDVPMSAVSVIDADTHYILGSHGLGDLCSVARSASLCAHSLLNDELLEVEDTTRDDRFCDNPLVVNAPHVRAYAAKPIVTREGARIGAIAVLDVAARRFSRVHTGAIDDAAMIAARILEDGVLARERDDARRAAEQSETRMRFALDAADIGDWDMDLRTNVARRSPMHDRCFGYHTPVERWGYDTFLAHVHPEDRERVDRAFRDAMATAGVYDTQFRAMRPDGSIRWLWSKGRFYADRDGTLVRVAGIQVDVDDRMQAEAQRIALERRLVESEKLEALGLLAGGIAHDFNNVIGIVLGNAMLAREDVASGTSAAVAIDEVRRAAERARDLVRQILVFGRREAPVRRRVEIRAAFDEALSLLRPLVSAQITIDARVPVGIAAIDADRLQLQRVLVNLVTNAVQAIGDQRGAIVIEAVDASSDVDDGRPADAAQGDFVHLSVTDDGPGIDAAHLGKIFDPFFTTKSLGEGSGLGLSVVHGIVKAHGGAITVSSTPGHATRFDVWWPVASNANDAAPPTPAMVDAPHVAARRATVMYVDDDASLLFLVERMLRSRGYDVLVYASSRDALAALSAARSDVDVVVSDYHMPGQSGLQFARDVMARRPELPVILMSGYITDAVRDEAHAAGVRAMIQKASTVEELFVVLRETLHEVIAPVPST